MSDIKLRLNAGLYTMEKTGEKAWPYLLLRDTKVEIERLEELLNGRDDFIVVEGLWDKFIQRLRHSRHGQGEIR